MGFSLLGLSVIVHVTLVNLVLGFSVITPLTEYLSYRRSDEELMDVARRSFKFLVVSDLVAGVWGTWITVVLGGLWPTLTYIVTTVLFVPITIAVLGILISIPSIAIYWYSWGKVSRRIHLLVGAFMGFGALLVPLGFRMIFSFIDNPIGFNQALAGDLYAVFANPIYPVIVLKSWFGALTMSTLLAAGIYAWNSRKSGEREGNLKASHYLLALGIPFLLVQSILGITYLFTLQNQSPYIFAAITANAGVAQYDFLPLFLAHPTLVLVMWVSAVAIFVQQRGARPSRLFAILLILSTALALPIGEVVNDASRAPYMIVNGTSGSLASVFVNSMIPVSWSIADLAVAVAVVVMSVFFVILYVIFAQKPGNGEGRVTSV
jgi:cytochrome d ubiquinol oxidase subunit I